MRKGQSIMDTEVAVKLSADDIEARQDALLSGLEEVERLQAKKAADSKANQKAIDQALGEVHRLRRILRDQQELRKQGDLRFGDAVVPSAEQATAALAAVAAAAEAPKPSEPHPFVGVASAEPLVGFVVCATCGADETDPVHHWALHLFAPNEADAEQCTLCTGRRGNAVHATECDHGVPLTHWCDGCQTTDEAAHEPHPYRISGSDACLTCGSIHEAARIHRSPVAVVTLPEDVVCLSCKAGECKVHPHAFSPGEPENKCARCGKGQKARIHAVAEANDVKPDAESGEERQPDPELVAALRSALDQQGPPDDDPGPGRGVAALIPEHVA